MALSDGSIVSEHRRIQTDTACTWHATGAIRFDVALPAQHTKCPGAHFAALLFEDNEPAPSLLLDL